MSVKYPIKFTLSDGVHVVVSKINDNTFDFSLTEENGNERHFTMVEDGRSKDELIDTFDFDQLNAVRRYWLEIDEH